VTIIAVSVPEATAVLVGLWAKAGTATPITKDMITINRIPIFSIFLLILLIILILKHPYFYLTKRKPTTAAEKRIAGFSNSSK